MLKEINSSYTLTSIIFPTQVRFPTHCKKISPNPCIFLNPKTAKNPPKSVVKFKSWLAGFESLCKTMLNSSFAGWVNSFLGCIGVCLGSYSKSASCIPTHGSQIFSSDYFWTSSMNDIDMSANLSQRTHSSLSASNQILVCDVGPKLTNGHPEFVNHGLLLWNKVRNNWTGGKKQSQKSHQALGRMINIYSTYESLLGTNRAFRKPIPLSEMVEFLVDTWDEEGLYD